MVCIWCKSIYGIYINYIKDIWYTHVYGIQSEYNMSFYRHKPSSVTFPNNICK